LRSNQIADELKIDARNIRRDINSLQSLKLIEFKGSPKTGGYFVAEELNKVQ